MIGNCSYLGYIDTAANVKWMCLPRFDSSFVFGSLLDEKRGGEFSITPTDSSFQTKQYYLDNTNILCTEFFNHDWHFRVIDFAPRFRLYDRNFRPLMFIRKIELLRGNPFITVKCLPVNDYGKITSEIVTGSNHIRYMNFGTQVRLTTDIPLNYIIESSPFVLSENRYLVFTYGVPLEAPLVSTAEDFLDKTKKYWQLWVKSTSIPHFYQREIIRSALVLKLHQYEDTGGIIAAGTASLPEYDQTGRNWDYRYCWLRDTYYTLNAFNHIGHFEELEKYFQYIQNIILNEQHRIQPVYSVTGQKKLTELILDLDGYLGNKPVRIGNDAYTHIQNDNYGQVLVSLLPLLIDQRLNIDGQNRSLPLVNWLLDRIAQTMDEPDAGIWEFRNTLQRHCYTFLFHWAGSKAAYKIGQYANDQPLKRKALKLIRESARHIESCYDDQRKVYLEAIGVPQLDASTLQLIVMNYLRPNSRRAVLHLEALEKELKTNDGLFYRYRHADDFGKPKSTFLVCAFWHVEALACIGRVKKAIEYFEQLLPFSNHLGLFSEDVDADGNQWGNFPQTYSHVGLINAAFRIANKLDLPLFH